MSRAFSLMSTVACLMSTPAMAEGQATHDPAVAPVETAAEASIQDTNGGLEEIVVTATRRTERLQDIPVTVTAVTGSTISEAGITELRSLTQVVPAFTGSRNMGVSQPGIRGVSSSGLSVGDESNVATYIDGIYQADPWSTFLELVEVERVEVLRGPQGTVFGRNATGGLINVITPDPSFKSRGRIAARLGRTRNKANDLDVRSYLTGGLTDKVAMDFAGLYRENGAYIKDLVRGGHIGDERVVNLRSKLLFQPSEAAKIVVTGEYADQNSSRNASQPHHDNAAGRAFSGVIIPAGPWQASLNFKPIQNYERYNLALQTHFDLGGLGLETSTGYMHTDVLQYTDSDATNINLGSIYLPMSVETISQEVRLLSSSAGPLKWILGAYAFYLNGSMDADIRTAPNPSVPLSLLALRPEIKTTSFAGFAEGTYELTNSLFLTLGGRFTTEKREFQQEVNGNRLFAPSFVTKKTFDKWTYRVAVRYNFAPDANVYASYGTGFKSGVFNALGTSPGAVNPETISAAEIGLKMDPLTWLRTNLAIYHYDYKDLQVQARNSQNTVVLQNAANATIYGGELEVTAAATDDLNIRASAAYTHGEYDRFIGAQNFIPLPQGGNREVRGDVSGNNIVRAPRYTFNLGFDWAQRLAGGKVQLAGNIFRSAKVYYDPLNLVFQKAYTLASGEISWTTPGETLRISLWAKNIINAKVAQQIRVGVFGNDLFYEQPRRIGVGAEYRF